MQTQCTLYYVSVMFPISCSLSNSSISNRGTTVQSIWSIHVPFFSCMVPMVMVWPLYKPVSGEGSVHGIRCLGGGGLTVYHIPGWSRHWGGRPLGLTRVLDHPRCQGVDPLGCGFPSSAYRLPWQSKQHGVSIIAIMSVVLCFMQTIDNIFILIDLFILHHRQVKMLQTLCIIMHFVCHQRILWI